MDDKILEAKIIGRYLIGITPSSFACELYASNINNLHFCVEPLDLQLWKFILKHPFFIGFIDAGLFFVNKDSSIRKRIFVMLAVLNTIPQYYSFFSTSHHHLFYFFKVMLVGFRSIYRGVIGFFLIKIFGQYGV